MAGPKTPQTERELDLGVVPLDELIVEPTKRRSLRRSLKLRHYQL